MKSLAIRATLTATALAALAGLAIVSQTGAASARDILSCEGGSRRSVVECCERQVMKKGLPIWMRQTGANCQSLSIRCTSGASGSSLTHASKRLCVAVNDHQPGSNNPGGGKNPVRPGGNTPGGGNPNGNPGSTSPR